MKKIKLSICLIACFLSVKKLSAQTATVTTTTSTTVVTTAPTATTTLTTEVGTNSGTGAAPSDVNNPDLKEPISNQDQDLQLPDNLKVTMPCGNETPFFQGEPLYVPNCQGFSTDTSFTGNTIWIPVRIFHGKTIGSQDFSENEYKHTIEVINQLLNNLEVYPGLNMANKIPQEWKDISAHDNNRIQLYLPNYQVDGEIGGSKPWLKTSLIQQEVNFNLNDVYFAFSDILGNDPRPRSYLPIYIASYLLSPEDGGIYKGYATLPDREESGVFIEEDAFFQEVRLQEVIHEIGHWLGLSHIWGNKNDGQNCYSDFIDDTPPQKEKYVGLANPNVIPSTCGDPDNIFNYMGYTDIRSMFTDDQYDLMTRNLSCHRNRKNAWRDLWTRKSDVINDDGIDKDTDPDHDEQLFITGIQIVEEGFQEQIPYIHNQLEGLDPANYSDRLEAYDGKYGYAMFHNVKKNGNQDAIIELFMDKSYGLDVSVAAKKKLNNANGSTNYKIAAYVDCNRDGDFDDQKECITDLLDFPSLGQIATTDGPATHEIPLNFEWDGNGLNYTAVMNAMDDYLDEKYTYNQQQNLALEDIFLPTRMRIVVSDGDSDPSGRAENGEVHDYALKIYETSELIPSPFKSGLDFASLIYPNPAQDELTLLTNATEIERVEFYNITTGELVLNHSLTQNKETQVTLDIRSLSANSEYIVKIVRCDGRTIEEHLIKR